jgi:lysophospholipase L1-like esterase
MNKLIALAICAATGLLCGGAMGQKPSPKPARTNREVEGWIGTWGTAPQHFVPGNIDTFRNQTLRLIVHTSVAGKKVRVEISNTFGDQPLVIGSARIARRVSKADIDPASNRKLTFGGHATIKVAARSKVISDSVDLRVPALSDLAISLFLPASSRATTSHVLALQTSFVSGKIGDSTGAVSLPKASPITSWPFLTGVDVAASPRTATIVALGSSLTDGDGSTMDANRRWPDALAIRLQRAGDRGKELGVLNEGIIGNRLLSDSDSPRQAGGPPPLGPVLAQLGPALGQSGLKRFERDVLMQPGVKYVVLALGVNDILFPGSFIPNSERVNAQSITSGYRQLIARAHKKGIRVIGSTIPPFEHAIFRSPFFGDFYTPEKDHVRQVVNAWILSGGEFDGVIDFDKAVRDPAHPAQLLPAYDSGDHLHPNDAGNVAQANSISIALFKAV